MTLYRSSSHTPIWIQLFLAAGTLLVGAGLIALAVTL